MKFNIVLLTAALISSVVSAARISPRTSGTMVSKRFDRTQQSRERVKRFTPKTQFVPKSRFSRRDVPKLKCTEESEEGEYTPEKVAESLTFNDSKDLEQYVSRLKEFIDETHFDVIAFDKVFDSLKEELEDIDFSVHKEKLTPEILTQLTFAKDLFAVMDEALVEYLKAVESPSSPENPWAYKMAELNVQAWALFDLNGMPDVKMEGYEEKAMDLHVEVTHLRQIFEKSINKAENSIGMLMSSVWK